MNILIVGNGAREYSIALSLKQDTRVSKIYFNTGNGATNFLGKNISVKGNENIVNFCIDNSIDLVIIGPETPLVDGLSDVLRLANIRVFAPSQKAAMLEGSKIFMKKLLHKYNIKTAEFIQGQGSDLNALYNFIDKTETDNIVIKADGLCSGKGVLIASSKQEAKDIVKNMLSGKLFGEAGKSIVIEEFLDGYELSVFAISDGKNFILLPPAQDHKQLLNNNLGPNTGGMGAYSPSPLCDDKLLNKIKKSVIRPILDAMSNEGCTFEGVLFCGIMVVDNEPYVLEFNVRFGDPECEVILPLLKTKLLDLINATIDKKLDTFVLELLDKHCVGVVAASSNYPFSSSAIEKIEYDNINYTDNSVSHISFAGVVQDNNVLYANGGRVYVSVGIGDSISEARDNAYKLIGDIKFNGMQFRSDIAYQVLK